MKLLLLLGVKYMRYPIKYLENNLVFNHDGECFAYYGVRCFSITA